MSNPLRPFLVTFVFVLLSSTAVASAEAPSVAPSHPGGTVTLGELPDPEATRQLLEERIVEAMARGEVTRSRGPVLRGGAPIVNLNSGQTYSDLELAVAGATAGDTLRIQQNLNVGQIVIDRDLQIEGLTGSETISVSEDTGSVGDDRAWFHVEPGVELDVMDLVFDGSGFKVYQGFRHEGSGVFEGVEFRNISYEESGPAYQGAAIVAFGDAVDVLDSHFEGIGRIGVLYYGPGVTGSLFSGNTYLGKQDGDFLDYGVELGAGAAVSVWNNTLQDCRGIASVDGSSSAALLATTALGAGTQLLARSNQLLDSNFGAVLGADATDSTTATFEFDRIAGSTFSGIETESTVPLIAERVWWGCNAGPGAGSCDVIGGAAVGSADADPWLVLTATADQTMLCTGGSTPVQGTLTMDSDGGDVSGLGSVDNGIQISFAADLGTVSAASVGTSFGVATVDYSATDAGSASVDVGLDTETVSIGILVEDAIFCDSFESGDTTAWN